MRISDWSSDVCSSDLGPLARSGLAGPGCPRKLAGQGDRSAAAGARRRCPGTGDGPRPWLPAGGGPADRRLTGAGRAAPDRKSVVSGKSVSVRVDLGGRRVLKKKKSNTENKKNQ